MKKVLFLLLIIVVTVSLLALGIGCKTSAAISTSAAAETTAAETTAAETTAAETTAAAATLSTEPVTLNIIFEQSSGDVNKIDNQIFADFMKQYPNVTIKAQVYQGDQLGEKIRNTIAAGGPLDGFMITSFEAAWFLEKDTVAEIDPSILGMTTDKFVAQWLPGSFETTGVSYKGKILGVPYNVANYAGFLNVANMKKAGLDPKKDIPKTWDEARAIAKKMTVVEGGVTKQDGWYQFPGVVQDVYILNSLFQQKGLDWRSLDGMIAGCDTQEAVDVLKMYTDVVTVDKSFDPKTFDPQWAPLANGVASMWFWGGPWMFGLVKTGGGNPDDIIAFPYPRFEGGKDLGGMSYGYGLFIPKISENKDWTLKFFDFWTSRPELFTPAAIYLPRTSFDASILASSFKDWDVFSAELPKATPSIVDSRVAETNDAVIKAESRVIYDGISAADSIKQLKSDLEAIKNK
jgi:multiple sugar transport system substrate-binding protein